MIALLEGNCLIDTHAHIFTEDFDEDRDEMIERCRVAGVGRILLPNLDDNSISTVIETADRYPDLCLPMLGLHPSYVDGDYVTKLSVIRAALEVYHDRCVGIGEIGLDYYWSLEYKAEMNSALRTQLEWAVEYNLPVSLHARDATLDTVRAVEDVDPQRLKGVFHSFTGNLQELEAILRLQGFYVGINGVITFKNNALKSFIAEHLPLDRILIETDAPYLAPVPYRGKRNEPAHLTYIQDCLCNIYGVTEEYLRERLFANSVKLFNFTSV